MNLKDEAEDYYDEEDDNDRFHSHKKSNQESKRTNQESRRTNQESKRYSDH